jgi:hypothetical protein
MIRESLAIDGRHGLYFLKWQVDDWWNLIGVATFLCSPSWRRACVPAS